MEHPTAEKRHNLYARTYADECDKIMEQNFATSYESAVVTPRPIGWAGVPLSAEGGKHETM